jgi:hypothetical protein
VLFAVIAAGLIIYRNNSSDVVTAANEPVPPAAAHSNFLSPSIIPAR